VLGHSTSGKRDFYDMLVETGHEGVILKHHAAQYGDGWIKVKRYSTLDVVITGYTEAKHGKTGKYDGLIGALVVSVWDGKTLVEVGQVSGMTDAERLMFSRHRDRYQGKVIEIAAQEMAKDRLRHPRYKRLRPEASARDATLRKLHADLKAATHAATET
jgi:ATP-dependent DNA ligase